MPATGGAFEKVGVRAVVEGFAKYISDLGKMNAKLAGHGQTVRVVGNAYSAASNSIRNQFSRSISGLAGANRKAERSVGRLGGAMQGLGKTALAVGTGFIAAQAGIAVVQKAFSKSIGAAIKFEAQLAEIRALTGATAEDTEFLAGAIKDMAREMPKSAAELGAGAYFILSSGIEDAAEAAGVLEVAAKASTIGLGETEAVANALTTVLNAYGKSADEAGQVTDVMIEAVKQGKAEADAFAGVLGRVVPLAAQMGISFEEVSANLATFTRLGVSADLAATGLRQVMASLLKPTEDQVEAMEELGFSAEGLRQQIKDKGLLVTLDAMMKATGGNEAAVARLFPNIRALTSVLGTVGVQMDDYTDILAATTNATGNLEEGFGIVADTTQFKVQMAMQNLNLVLMDMGETTLPALAAGAEKVADALNLIVAAGEAVIWPFQQVVKGTDAAAEATRQLLFETHALDKAIEERGQTLLADAQAMREGRKSTEDIAEETAAFDVEIKALADSLGIGEDRLRLSGLGMDDLRARTAGLRELIALLPSTWQAFDKELAKSAMIQAELEGAIGDTAEKVPWLSSAINALSSSLKGAVSANKELMSSLSGITSQRTQETHALDVQINALELGRNAALQAEVGQESLGGAVSSTTDALGRQVGALNNLAASMVPQALNNEIIALDRELKVLEKGKAAIEAQINARNRLAQAQLAMAHVANLPALAKQKKLELEREKILAKVGGNVDDLTDAQKEQVEAIDAEILALQTSINVKTLEAELTNLQAEASDKNREAMEQELNKIIDQIGATTDLKHQRELYIDTLVPVQLLQDIDALGRQKTALDNSKTGAEGATGAISTLSDTIGDQITKLGLEREAIDLVTEGWKLQAEAMLGLPKMEDIRKQLLAFKALLLMQTMQSIIAALGRLDLGAVAELTALLRKITAFQPAQHGFHGTVTGPQGFFIEPGRTERVDITPQSQPILAPSVAPQAAAAAGGGVDPAALAGAVAFALQGMTVEMDGRIVGSLINDRIGDRTSLLGRGG